MKLIEVEKVSDTNRQRQIPKMHDGKMSTGGMVQAKVKFFDPTPSNDTPACPNGPGENPGPT